MSFKHFAIRTVLFLLRCFPTPKLLHFVVLSLILGEEMHNDVSCRNIQTYFSRPSRSCSTPRYQGTQVTPNLDDAILQEEARIIRTIEYHTGSIQTAFCATSIKTLHQNQRLPASTSSQFCPGSPSTAGVKPSMTSWHFRLNCTLYDTCGQTGSIQPRLYWRRAKERFLESESCTLCICSRELGNKTKKLPQEVSNYKVQLC